jgi:hypothetical protein
MNDTLKEYLNQPNLGRKVHFLKDEAPELIIGIYMALRATLWEGCSIIEVTDEELISKKYVNGPPIGSLRFPTMELLIPSNMRRTFDSILSRDVIINSSLELIYETDERAVYRIL